MFCSKCGNKINKDHNYCEFCGFRIPKLPRVQLPIEENKKEIVKDFIKGEFKEIQDDNKEEIKKFKYSEDPRGYLSVIISEESEKKNHFAYTILVISISIILYQYIMNGFLFLENFWSLISLPFLIWGVWLIYKRKKDPMNLNNNIYKLVNNSNYSNIYQLSEDFVKSYEYGIIDLGSYNLTNKFIFKDNNFSFELFILSDLHWIYKKITKHRVNFVPVGKTYCAVLNFKSGKCIEISGSEENVDKNLIILVTLCPWVKLGYE